MHIHAANKNNIKMIGTIILWFYDSSKCRQNLKWIVYVTGDADKLPLSQESCTALGRFSLHFLTMDEALHLTPATKPDKVSEATGKLTHALLKKMIFTACHSGKLKLAFTSPDVISTSPKNFLFVCYSNSS